jgi:putative ribosome biogenesis GTPase RsgA
MKNTSFLNFWNDKNMQQRSIISNAMQNKGLILMNWVKKKIEFFLARHLLITISMYGSKDSIMLMKTNFLAHTYQHCN